MIEGVEELGAKLYAIPIVEHRILHSGDIDVVLAGHLDYAGRAIAEGAGGLWDDLGGIEPAGERTDAAALHRIADAVGKIAIDTPDVCADVARRRDVFAGREGHDAVSAPS